MARITRSTIVNAIHAKHGVRVSLAKGEGYFYFYSDAEKVGLLLNMLQSTSVYVYTLGQMTLDQWVASFEALFDGEEVSIEDLKEVVKVKVVPTEGAYQKPATGQILRETATKYVVSVKRESRLLPEIMEFSKKDFLRLGWYKNKFPKWKLEVARNESI